MSQVHALEWRERWGWFELGSSFEVKFVVNFSLQTNRHAKKMLRAMLMYRSTLMIWMKVLKAFGVVVD
jgi:hypothetical protein